MNDGSCVGRSAALMTGTTCCSERRRRVVQFNQFVIAPPSAMDHRPQSMWIDDSPSPATSVACV